MWQAKLFGSLPMLLNFVNEHRLEHHQFKVVIVPPRIWQRRSGPRYYLIYRVHIPDQELLGLAGAVVDEVPPIDEESAVDTAAAIIHDAQHRGEGPREPRRDRAN